MAAGSTRTLWKGAISFGLVHIPVALHSATQNQGIDFDWLDKRTMDPVGYKRINKATGKEISSENVVKGVEYEDGEYVVLTSDEIQAAYPRTTQTVEIEAFVPLKDIPFVYLDRPYYLAPINKGAKVYSLLREILLESKKVALAKVVIQTKQHLALVMACGPALILNLLRWDNEIRTWQDLDLPAAGVAAAGLSDKEMKMGLQLVDDMSAKWKPEAFTDSFRDQIMELVKEKAEAGDIESVSQPEDHEPTSSGAKILDLTEMLQRSLGKKAATSTRTGSSSASDADPKNPSKPAAKKRKTSDSKATPSRARTVASKETKPPTERKTATKEKATNKKKTKPNASKSSTDEKNAATKKKRSGSSAKTEKSAKKASGKTSNSRSKASSAGRKAA